MHVYLVTYSCEEYECEEGHLFGVYLSEESANHVKDNPLDYVEQLTSDSGMTHWRFGDLTVHGKDADNKNIYFPKNKKDLVFDTCSANIQVKKIEVKP